MLSMAEGKPIFIRPPNSFKGFSFNDKNIFNGSIFLNIKIRAMIVAIILLKAVAIAAPLTPNSGKPNKPKIKRTSPSIFIIFISTVIYMVCLVCP